MAIDTSKLMKSSLGLIGSGIGAYNNLSPIEDIEQYTSQALQLGNSNYQLGSLLSLADLYAQRNIPQSITGKTLYNPSAGERFGQLFGSGLSGFLAGYNFADNFTDNMGTTLILGGSGYNTASGKGWGKNEEALKQQAQILGYADGGPLVLDNGSMVNAASGLAMAGINMGLNAIANSQRRKQAELDALRYNALRDFAIDRNTLDFQRAVEDSTDNMFNMQALQMKANGGKIYIKPSKRGTFTAAAKSRGMGVQEFASKVLANKENYSTAMIKKANFARNFESHKHSEGGYLEGQEYDVTEEEIKMLKELGYEFEYL